MNGDPLLLQRVRRTGPLKDDYGWKLALALGFGELAVNVRAVDVIHAKCRVIDARCSVVSGSDGRIFRRLFEQLDLLGPEAVEIRRPLRDRAQLAWRDGCSGYDR